MKAIPGYLDITPGDFKEVYRLAYQHALERLSRAVTAREIMTREVVTVRPDTPLAEVAEAMGRRGVSGVPVVDPRNKVVGVISEKDFLTHMGVQDAQKFHEPGGVLPEEQRLRGPAHQERLRPPTS